MHVFRLQSLERSVHSWFDWLSVIVAYDGNGAWNLCFSMASTRSPASSTCKFEHPVKLPPACAANPLITGSPTDAKTNGVEFVCVACLQASAAWVLAVTITSTLSAR